MKSPSGQSCDQPEVSPVNSLSGQSCDQPEVSLVNSPSGQSCDQPEVSPVNSLSGQSCDQPEAQSAFRRDVNPIRANDNKSGFRPCTLYQK